MSSIGIACGLLACSGPGPAPGPVEPTPIERFRIVATERGPGGGRLVWIDEDGRRMRELSRASAGVKVSDLGASWSPDGRWIVFASSRGRSRRGETSLWVISTAPDARPRRLTLRESVDRNPVWTPDGRALVFSSILRRGSSLDLWRAELEFTDARVRVSGLSKLTDTASEHEDFPSVSPDGSQVVYQRASDREGSSIWRLPMAGGEATQITKGPADLTPAYAPSGQAIAIARAKKVRLPNGGVRVDMDLYLLPADGGHARHLVPEPYADQLRPVWSKDGRFLFANSVYRSATTDEPLLGSITFVDLKARKLDLYALHEPTGAITRRDVALSPTGLIDAELVGNETYRQALYRAFIRERERAAGAASGANR